MARQYSSTLLLPERLSALDATTTCESLTDAVPMGEDVLTRCATASADPRPESVAEISGGETLLIVEDEADVRHLAVAVLEGEGYTVLRAANGQDALGGVREHAGDPIALVVTDVVMPKMGGRVMAEWLRTFTPDLKFLFTSGYNEEAIRSESMIDRGVSYLPKPYTASALVRKVRAMLKGETEILEQ